MNETTMVTINIGQVAKATGVTVETVRYYEKQGLITSPERSESGYRQYPESTIKRVKFIQHAKDVGFTLKEISDLLSLRNDQNSSCAEVKRRAEEKIVSVDKKIQDLMRIKQALSQMADKCQGQGPVSDCPILEELELDEE